MYNTFLYDDCCFLKISLTKKKYTDGRKGAPFYYIARLTKGKARLRSQGENIYINAGDVFFIPKNIPYESFWTGAEIEWYSYGFSYFPEMEHNNYKIQKIDCEESLKEELITIPTSVHVTSRTLGAFYGILDKLLDFMCTDESTGEEGIFRKSKGLMEKHMDWNISDIAKACHISYSTLYAIYKNICGKTPNTIRQEILVQRATMLLSTTDISVQEISDTLGFSSTSYLRKILKQYTALTPTQIRKSRKHML